jgi:hypothetical protein
VVKKANGVIEGQTPATVKKSHKKGASRAAKTSTGVNRSSPRGKKGSGCDISEVNFGG